MGLQSHQHNPDEWREACSGSGADEGPGCQVPDANGFHETFGWRSAKSSVSSAQPRLLRRMWSWLASRARHVGRSRRMGSLAPRGTVHEQEQAWQLLTQLMATDPERRPSAAEALLGSYLNSDCSEIEVPVSAPEAWTLEGLKSAMGLGGHKVRVSEECALLCG